MELIYRTPGDRVTGWRYLWAKHVTGFNPERHCARCLEGTYLEAVSLGMPVNLPLVIDVPDGAVVYLCGVALPYRWANNLHLAVRIKAGATAAARAYNGNEIEVRGAEAIPFDDQAARRLYPGKGSAFLTCRNFQFGSALYGR